MKLSLRKIVKAVIKLNLPCHLDSLAVYCSSMSKHIPASLSCRRLICPSKGCSLWMFWTTIAVDSLYICIYLCTLAEERNKVKTLCIKFWHWVTLKSYGIPKNQLYNEKSDKFLHSIFYLIYISTCVYLYWSHYYLPIKYFITK